MTDTKNAKFTDSENVLMERMIEELSKMSLARRTDRELFAPIAAAIINTREAAPDLYDALKSIQSHLSVIGSGFTLSEAEVLRIASAALAKATPGPKPEALEIRNDR